MSTSDAARDGTESAISDRARALHAASIVIDAHSDILMGLTDGTADWEDGPPTSLTDEGCDGQVSLSLLRAGGVTAQVFALFTAPFGIDYRVVRPEYAGATLPRALGPSTRETISTFVSESTDTARFVP